MKIIALRGRSDVGKTSSIKLLICELIEKGASVEYCFNTRKMLLRIIDRNDRKWYTASGRNVQNITVALKFKGKIIVIATVGDSTDLIKNAFLQTIKHLPYDSSHINGYICGCHPKMDLTRLPEFKGCEIEFIEKSSGELENSNFMAKNQLMQAIEKM